MAANTNNARFNHIKARMAKGEFWGIKGLDHKKIDGCLDLIVNHITAITDEEELLNALISTCWQIVIAKGYGKTKRDRYCRLRNDQVDRLIDAMEKAVQSSGLTIKPKEIFEGDYHPTVISLFDELRGYYDDDIINTMEIDCSPKMYSFRADRWDGDLADGVMSIDEPLLGDLTSLSDEQIVSKLRTEYKRRTWEYTFPLVDLAGNIRKGDIIIARQGRSKVLGFGVVTSDYYYDAYAREFKHRRKVEWTERHFKIDANVGYMLGAGYRKIRCIPLTFLYRMMAKRLGIASCQKALERL
ncbi:MAG: hypothetical protein IKF77_08475 [Thermoguttaceae bacterium]|nr:hypothetical protein [Thermoguttaceae bacterium]